MGHSGAAGAGAARAAPAPCQSRQTRPLRRKMPASPRRSPTFAVRAFLGAALGVAAASGGVSLFSSTAEVKQRRRTKPTTLANGGEGQGAARDLAAPYFPCFPCI